MNYLPLPCAEILFQINKPAHRAFAAPGTVASTGLVPDVGRRP